MLEYLTNFSVCWTDGHFNVNYSQLLLQLYYLHFLFLFQFRNNCLFFWEGGGGGGQVALLLNKICF